MLKMSQLSVLQQKMAYANLNENEYAALTAHCAYLKENMRRKLGMRPKMVKAKMEAIMRGKTVFHQEDHARLLYIQMIDGCAKATASKS